MLFSYQGVNKAGEERKGTIESINIDAAINSLQNQGVVLSSIVPIEERKSLGWFSSFHYVSARDIVILSRQMSTLFEAKVPALRIFKLLANEAENKILRETLDQVANDLQSGSSISQSLAKHPDVFSDFYVNMVRSGEESGRLDEIFNYLADYLDRTYEVASKVRGALIYPAFVIAVFVAVMSLMLTMIIPKITAILIESGRELPIYTKLVIWTSDFFIHYGIFLLVFLIVGGFFLGKYIQTPEGALAFDRFRLNVPYLGDLYKKLFLSRVADNMSTMIASGIPMLRAIEVTSSVVGSALYRKILAESLEAVKGGSVFSASLVNYSEVPTIMVQMVKVGEETGELGNILNTMAKFYQREVTNAVDTLISLIEPLMVVVLGVGVGILLAAVLIPIYDVATLS
ncbi:MAG: type II secretion system F family protein [Patescibacteria group bacterium]|nr:type II secretion system F family protein [bacterium]MDZ4240907.1 type II secretion system F family protein [Patescibacteria group bacterium]